MLADWYVCCCIGLNPDQTTAFLAILDALENPADDDQIAIYEIQELRKADVWLQAYAFHKVLKFLRPKNNSHNVLPIIKDYFNGILEFVPEEIQNYYQALFPKVISSAMAKDSALNLLDQIALCANEAENLPVRLPAPVPYLDLKEFLPETILLSAIYEGLVADHNIKFALATRLESDQNFHSLYRIFEKAQRGQLGRLAFQLSIQIDAKIPSRHFSREELFRTLSRSFTTINYEPDLLRAYADILFIGDQVNETLIEKKGEIIDIIVNEIANLTELRNLQNNVVRPENNNDPLERIGLPATSKRLMFNLPIVYWQATLWELIADYDPVLAGNALAKNWEIPRSITPEIAVSTKLESNEASNWKYQLNSLLILRGLNNKTSITMKKDSRQEIQPSSSWIFLSPWFRLSNEYEKSQNKFLQYPEVEKHDALIRLLSGVLVSTKILQSLGSRDDNSTAFASFIAHASDVLNYYRFWLRNYANPEKNESDHKIPLQLTGLTLFGIRQINLVGKGLIRSVDPNIFLDLLKRKEEIIDSRSSDDVKKFLNVSLPEVLMYWIVDAYPGVIDSNGPGRWLELIPEVYWFYRQGGHDFHNRVAAALVVRYLTPDFKLKIDRDLNWRTSKFVQDQKSWNLNHRLLLLSERGLSPHEWQIGDWEEPDWNNPKSNKQSQLVRAIERLISVRFSGTNFEGSEGWHLDWTTQLNSVSTTTDLDRFTRLRLIELNGDPVFRDLPDDMILVANIVLEYGCAYDLSLLIEKIFCFNNNPLDVNDEAWQILQSTFLQSLYVEYKRLEIDDSENNYQSIQDPRSYRINRQRLNIIEQTLIKVAYWGIIARNQGIKYSLADELHNMQMQSKSKLVAINLRSTKATFEVRGKTKRILLEDNSKSVGEWNIRAAIVNPNVQTADLFYEDLDDDGIINLFSLSERDVLIILNSQNKTPIQVVSTVVAIEELRNSRAKIVFNCGIKFYLEMVFQTPLEYSVGDFVSLKIYKGGDDFRWRAARDTSPKKLRPRIRIGDIGLVSVKGSWYEGKRSISLSRGKSLLQFDKALWEPDISGVYCEEDGSLQREIQARYDGENTWSPVDHDFIDFLYQAVEPNSQFAILTLIEKVEVPNNQFAWRVSRIPGENYLIPNELFVPEDLFQLNSYVQQFANPIGLLVALKPDVIDNQICVKLFSDENIPTSIIERYPSLRVPCDNRNIAWKNLFGTSMIAENEGANWFVVLDKDDQIPGFPQKILVQWDRYRASGGLQRAEFTSTLWGDDECRTATVYGDALYTNKIKPRDGRWHEFVDKWLGISIGAKLTIVRTNGNMKIN